MACHNSELYINRAIESVLAQSIDDWEMIIVDDCSVDQTLDICKFHAKNENRIKIYKHDQNLGAAAARNYAITHASGDWISILDSDDEFTISKLEKQKAYLSQTKNKKVVLIGSGSINYIQNNYSLLGRYTKIYKNNSAYLKSNLESFSAFPPHSSICYLRSHFKKVGSYNSLFLFAEDKELFLRLANMGQFATIEEPLTKIYIRPQSLSHAFTDKEFREYVISLTAIIYSKINSRYNIDSQDEILFEYIIRVVKENIEGSFFMQYAVFLQELRGESKFIKLTKLLFKPKFLLVRVFRKVIINRHIANIIKGLRGVLN
jgi:glycosyltransferase involved in cell wall biosynthesis